MQFPNNVNFKRVTIISICALVFGIVFGYLLFPGLLKKMLKSQLNLKPGSQVRQMYTKVPFYIDFRVYLFNLTNKEEVHRGGKPKVEQVGPYFFEEWKEKYDLVDDETDDSLTYHFKNTFVFRKDLSGPGLTGDEIITMPHPMIMTMALAVNVDKAAMLPAIVGGLNFLFHEPTDAFWTGRVMDLLYDGITIDCSADDFNAKAICSQFDNPEMKAIKKIDDTTFKFSLFAGTNGTDIGEMKVYRGVKKSSDVGRVISFNGDTEMDYWDGDECNHYVGTDSSIFPPFMKRSDNIFAYEPSICRSIAASYKEPSKYMGIKTNRFELDLGDKLNDKECFCRNPPDGCPPKGTFDLFRCTGTPMFGSLPHFYGGDPQLVNNFASGLKPNKDEHAIFMHFELLTGSPLSAAKRLQFNLEIVPIPDYPIMKDLQPMLYPLFWVEEGAHLNNTFIKPLKNTLFRMIKIVTWVKWLCIVLGALGTVLGIYFLYTKHNNEQTTVRPANKNPGNMNGFERS